VLLKNALPCEKYCTQRGLSVVPICRQAAGWVTLPLPSADTAKEYPVSKVEAKLQQSALIMQLVGWAVSVGLITALFIYPPGFLWGTHPDGFPFVGPAHQHSHLDGLHPYLYMLGAMYLALGILLIRGARDPLGNAALFDYGILANFLHAGVMIPQAFYYPNEHAHLWTDIPLAFGICLVLWYWHPRRIMARG
jgi:hypothetical protein